MFNARIDCGAMSSVFFVDDLDNARITLSVLLGNVRCAVVRAVIDNDDLHIFSARKQ